MQLFNFYDRIDFACRDGCGRDFIDYELAEVLIFLKYCFWTNNINIHRVTSCWHHHSNIYKELNEMIDRENVQLLAAGKPLKAHQNITKNSYHLIGKAADLHVDGVDNRVVHDRIDSEYPDKYGIILYRWGLHIDVRPKKHRRILV